MHWLCFSCCFGGIARAHIIPNLAIFEKRAYHKGRKWHFVLILILFGPFLVESLVVAVHLQFLPKSNLYLPRGRTLVLFYRTFILMSLFAGHLKQMLFFRRFYNVTNYCWAGVSRAGVRTYLQTTGHGNMQGSIPPPWRFFVYHSIVIVNSWRRRIRKDSNKCHFGTAHLHPRWFESHANLITGHERSIYWRLSRSSRLAKVINKMPHCFVRSCSVISCCLLSCLLA